jgi:twitching motility protein PilT
MSHPQLDSLLSALAAHDGSDLHVKGEAIPRIRVDGDLRRLQADPLTPATVSEMAAAIMRPDMADHFERRNEADFAYMLEGVGRFRVNAFRQRGSVAMIFRRVRGSAATIDDLGLPIVLARLANEPRGLVLVTGPTGSGKTTTLAAMIDHINTTREVHVVTIEDPIEVLHNDKMASIEQREIGVDTADFGTAMRAAMRQDPDVILVGEMRDEETVAAALSAAETGHLVLSTLHTIDATETVNRIVDFFPPHKQKQVRIALAGALKGIVCQRLVPRADKEGRVAVLEVMVANGRIAQCIAEPQLGGEISEIIADGEYYGMQTFDQHLARLVEEGMVDMEGASLGATNLHDLRVALNRKGVVSAGSRS